MAAGQASIIGSGNTLNIDQRTDKAIIDWRSFNIASDELTAFHQPSSSSLTLNRINDINPSQILGTLTANGHVILVNPNGVFFGHNARIDVSGLVASTADIRNDDFMAGNFHFSQPGNPNAAIVNQGTITAQSAGLVVFVAPFVENEGVIEAKLGKVELVSGDNFTLDMAGDNLIEVAVTGDVAQQLAGNTGKIAADGGTVLLTAAAGRQLVDGVASNGGVIEANSIGGTNGHIVLYAEGSSAVPDNVAAGKGQAPGSSTVLNSGTLTASGYGSGETGGTIKVLGDHVGILSGAAIDVSGSSGGGTVRIGGDFHGEGATPTAEATVMQTGASIKADAVTSGNGGDVSLWSDNYTNFAGNISARGGISGGNGGSVETSGKQILSMNGLVDASAPHSKAGTWLMDPADVTISTGSDSGVTGNPNFTPDGSQAEAVLNVNAIDTALSNGTDVTVTTGGDALAGANDGQITVADPISATTGTGGVTGSLTLSAYSNIVVNGTITLGSAGVSGGNLILDADNHTNGSGYIKIASALTTNGGDITIGGGSGAITAGSGYAVGNSGQAYGVYIQNAAVNAGGGNIIANGQGYNGSGSGNSGIYVNGSSAALETIGTGSLTLSGIGQGNTNSGSDIGVYVYGGGIVSTVNGDLTVTGVGGGAGSGVNNWGLGIAAAGSSIKTTGSGNLFLTGSGGDAGGSGGNNTGIYVAIANGIQATGSGSITLNATGGGAGGSGGQNYGIYAAAANAVTASGSNISITGTGGNSSGMENMGVYVTGGSITDSGGNLLVSGAGAGSGLYEYAIYLQGGTISNTGSGSVTVSGTAASGSNGTQFGIDVQTIGGTGSVISTVDGDLTVTATGGGAGGSDDRNYGLYVTGIGSAIEATGSGNLSIAGTGGDAGGSGGSSNFGVYVTSDASISSNGGALSLTGTGGGAGGSGQQQYGVFLYTGGSVAASGGNIAITGAAGNSSGNFDCGIDINGGSVSTTGNGTILLSGTASGNSNSNNDYGVYLLNGSAITTVNGDLTISGTGGSVGNDDYGINLTQSGSLRATGTGTVTAIAPGSDIAFDSSSSIVSNAFDTAITLATGQHFLNFSGAGALSAPNGRWLIYSTTPAADVLGGLNGNFLRFSCRYGGLCPHVPLTGNGLLYSSTLPGTVSKSLSDSALGWHNFQTQFHPVGARDSTKLITVDAQVIADQASPLLPPVDFPF